MFIAPPELGKRPAAHSRQSLAITRILGATVFAGMSYHGRHWLARAGPSAVCAGLVVVGCGGGGPPKPDRGAVGDVVVAFFEGAARKDVGAVCGALAGGG